MNGTEGKKDEKSKREKRGERKGRKRASGKSEYAAETKIRTPGRSTERASKSKRRWRKKSIERRRNDQGSFSRIERVRTRSKEKSARKGLNKQ